MSKTKEVEFSPWRGFLWPIHSHEMKKFLPLALIMLMILFNYTVVRALKDAMIVATKGSGAEVISFIKGWVVLPSSILFVLIFSKLANTLSRQALYYTCLVPFIAFFALFAFVIYPAKDLLHPSPETLASLQASYPHLRWFFPIYGLWTYSLFYVMAELWGNIGTNLLFWQFANQITPTHEAKRFYPMVGVVGNVALIAAGHALTHFSTPPEGVSPEAFFGVALQNLIGMVVVSGFGIAALYYWMSNYVMKQPDFYSDVPASEKKSGKAKKPKMSIMESIKYLGTSRYLGYITILVLGYGMSINFVEVTWKAAIREAYPDTLGYTRFMGQLYLWLGPVTIFILYAAKGVIRRFGWFTAAIATPTMILITGCLFFGFILFQGSLGGAIAFVGLTPLMAAVYAGMAQNILGKGTKYAMFDPSREMAYIPLDQEMKIKGKAAIDVVGGRLGKSGGGLVQMFLVTAMGGVTQITIAPYVAALLIVVVLIWMWAVKKLSIEYNALVEKSD